MIIWKTFHRPGKYPVLKTLLKIWVTALIPISGNSFKTLPVIRSYPGAFLSVIDLLQLLLHLIRSSSLGIPAGQEFQGSAGFPVHPPRTSQMYTA